MGKLRMALGAVFVADSECAQFELFINKGRIAHNSVEYFCNSEIDPIISENEDEKIKKLSDTCELIFTISHNECNSALICLGRRMQANPISEDEIKYAKLVSLIAGAALKNAENFSALQKNSADLQLQNQLLSSLFEMSRDFSVLLSKDQIVRALSYRLMGQLMVSRFCIYMADDRGGKTQLINRFDQELSEEALNEVFSIDKTVKIKDIQFSKGVFQELNKIKAKIFAPMISNGVTRGILVVGKKLNAEEFNESNLQFIEALGNRAIAALENERLVREEIEKKKLESELNLALEIQQNLLPMDTPELERGYSLSGESLPSRMVGGDYFDFIPLADSRILIAIADVSGKGMPAALLMANVQAALRALSPLALTLKDLTLRINSIVYRNTSPDKFVTFFVGIMDMNRHYFTYINSGHNPPILRKNNGDKVYLDVGGLILGLMEDNDNYPEATVDVEPGDMLCFYTDGVTEAPNDDGEEFGEERLNALLDEAKDEDTNEILKRIIRSVCNFSSADQRHDDITVAVLKREN
jgi:sigma-B regulation protein RsbU (phosphoserine phosphatase)